MHEATARADRLSAFSDAVIAVIITLMALELKAPEEPTLAALLPLWPTAVGYAVSYLFIAIIWVNHHHLLRFVDAVTPKLIWVNFGHLFLVSVVPFATAWMARTGFAAIPVAAYAVMFVCVNIAYLLFERTVFAQAEPDVVPEWARLAAKRRSFATLAIFASAALVALIVPPAGFGLVCCALILYLRPGASNAKQGAHASHSTLTTK